MLLADKKLPVPKIVCQSPLSNSDCLSLTIQLHQQTQNHHRIFLYSCCNSVQYKVL